MNLSKVVTSGGRRSLAAGRLEKTLGFPVSWLLIICIGRLVVTGRDLVGDGGESRAEDWGWGAGPVS